MLERLRQVVGREIRHRAGGVAASEVDKTDERYVRKLQQARGNTAAVRGGCATEEQARKVLLHRRTDQEYADLAAYCRVNERMAPDTYRCFIPDLYKTGWKACQHRSNVSAERTQAKIDARRQEAVRLGVGSTSLFAAMRGSANSHRPDDGVCRRIECSQHDLRWCNQVHRGIAGVQ